MRIKSLKTVLWIISMVVIVLFASVIWKVKAMASTGDFIIVNQILMQYVGSEKEVEIPEGVITIGESAFEGSIVEKVTIPYGVTLIDNRAFQDCSQLTEVILPETVLELGFLVFYNCTSLEIIDLPESLCYISPECFENCTNLETILFPTQEVYIGFWAFNNTAWLDNYDSDNVIVNHTIIKYKGNETQITIPEGVTIIGPGAYRYCKSIENVEIPYGVTKISTNAFEDCSGLTKIVLPDSITRVESYAFVNCCNLAEITIPRDVNIDRSAFDETKWMKDYVGEFILLNDILIGYQGYDTKVIVPDGVRVICTGAFNNNNVRELTIPMTVTKINYAAFINCMNLATVMFEGNNVEFDGQVLYECSENITFYGQSNGTIEKYASTFKINFIGKGLNKSKVTLYVNGIDTVVLKVKGLTGMPSWQSEDPLIATVNGDGIVTAVNAGTTRIKATVDGIKITCVIKVRDPYISKSKVSMKTDRTVRLSIVGTTETITWTSSDESVAIVSPTGVVTAQKAGTVTITATINEKTYHCIVTVK